MGDVVSTDREANASPHRLSWIWSVVRVSCAIWVWVSRSSSAASIWALRVSTQSRSAFSRTGRSRSFVRYSKADWIFFTRVPSVSVSMMDSGFFSRFKPVSPFRNSFM